MASKIFIGPAGTGGASEQGFIKVKESGLNAVEVAFTYGIWMKPAQAEKINKLNKKLNLKISIHAPYYLNLNSSDSAKIIASRKRILKCCEIGDILGAKYIVFHAGFYEKDSKEKTYERIKKQILILQREIKKNHWQVVLAPETTGKKSQFGTLDELLKLKKETGCHLCIDFAHLRARYNQKADYDEIMKKIRDIGFIHSHFSGIEYTEKGERRHLLTQAEDISELLKYFKKYALSATIINESPDPFGDSIKTKKILEKI